MGVLAAKSLSVNYTYGKSSQTRATSARRTQANGVRKGMPLPYFKNRKGEEIVESYMKV